MAGLAVTAATGVAGAWLGEKGVEFAVQYSIDSVNSYAGSIIEDELSKSYTSLYYQQMLNGLSVHCFPRGIDVLTDCGGVLIENIVPGDAVLSFDPMAANGRSVLVPKKVVRTFENITEEWLHLTWVEGGEEKELVTTPSHQFLSSLGGFKEIEQLVAGGQGTVVLADGTEAVVQAERLVYSAETAEMFEQAEGYCAHLLVHAAAGLEPRASDRFFRRCGMNMVGGNYILGRKAHV